MSASNRKDRIVCAGVYKGPLNLSKEALRAKVEALIDSLLAVPIAQKNYLNWEIVRPDHRYLVNIIRLTRKTERAERPVRRAPERYGTCRGTGRNLGDGRM
jgi:hypothetical protein